MKKLNKKLQLNKETIARISEDQQLSVLGGVVATQGCETENNCVVATDNNCAGSDRLCSYNNCYNTVGCPIIIPISVNGCVNVSRFVYCGPK